MKVRLTKSEFLHSWGIAERCTSANTGAPGIFSAVLFSWEADGAALRSTNIRTSAAVSAQGVEVIEPGAAVLPVKGVSDLFSKARADEMTLEVSKGKAVLLAGKSRYSFSTFPAADFPKLSSADGAEPVFSMPSAELARALECGGLCASAKDEYPAYISSVFFDMEGGLTVVSTDKRRMAVYSADGERAASAPLLLPNSGLRELMKILGMSKSGFDVCVSRDDAQAYFSGGGIEFSIRQTAGKFPNYKKIMPRSFSSRAIIGRAELLAALECVNIVVRDYARTVTVRFDGGECFLSGRAAEFGEANEAVSCDFSGEPLAASFNVGFLMDGVKACEGESVMLSFERPDGFITISPVSSVNFKYIAGPVCDEDLGDPQGQERAAS